MPLPPPPGLGAIDKLVHTCWTRVDHRRSVPLPFVVLLGTPGSGKTYALEHFARASRRAPSALLDFSVGDARRPHRIAVQIVFHLARKHRGLARLHFPRLLLGLVALEAALSATDPDSAKSQLREALRAARRRHVDPAQVATWVDSGAASFGLPQVPATEQIVTLLVRAFEYTPTSAILNRHLGWYARRNALSEHSALDELVDLNRRGRGSDPADLLYVDQLLCEAFLADLRAAYAHHPTGQNCLVLLDNIDHPGCGATAFLDLLARLRTEHVLVEPSSYDPLLVVATSSTTRAVPGPGDGRPGDPYICPAGKASYEDWLPEPGGPPDTWWYPLRLRDLTEIEVAQVGAAHLAEVAVRGGRRVRGDLNSTAPLVHRLSYGHPWSVRELHHAIGAMPSAGVADDELFGVLEAGVAAGSGERTVPLAELVRDRLMSGLSEDQRAAAVDVSAARVPSSAVNAGLLAGRTELARDTVMVELRHRLWLYAPVPEDANTRGGKGPPDYLGGDDRDPRPVLHPWLRLLLLEELAEGDGGRWRRAHERLRAWHQEQGRALDALYHQLALERLDTVVDAFVASFRSTGAGADGTAWLRELYHVTAAPLRRAGLPGGHAPHRASLLAQRLAPVNHADRELGRPLAELCAALWLAGDPRNRLPSGRPELNYRIGVMFRQLAMVPNADADTLLNEAARYST